MFLMRGYFFGLFECLIVCCGIYFGVFGFSCFVKKVLFGVFVVLMFFI